MTAYHHYYIAYAYPGDGGSIGTSYITLAAPITDPRDIELVNAELRKQQPGALLIAFSRITEIPR